MTDPVLSPEAAPTAPSASGSTYADRLMQQDHAIREEAAGRQPLRPYRSAATRARVLIGLLWISLLSSIVACAINVWGWLTIGEYLEGRVGDNALDTFDRVFGTFALGETALAVIAAVAWLAWQSRTVDNEDGLAIGPSPWSPAMSIVWWFVPLANLIQPYRIHRDIHRRYVGTEVSSSIVLVWWLLYLAGTLLAQAAGRVWLAIDTLEGLQGGLILWLIADALAAISAVPAVFMVRRIQARANALGRSIGSTSEQVPASDVPAVPTTP